MKLPQQFAILQRARDLAWLPGASAPEDHYELVEIGRGQISGPLGVVTRKRGDGFQDRIRSFFRSSYSLDLGEGECYRLIDTSTLLCFRWELRDSCDTLLGTVTSSLLGLGYRIILESASGELSRCGFRAWATSARIRDRTGVPLATLRAIWARAPQRPGLLRELIELDGAARACCASSGHRGGELRRSRHCALRRYH